MTFATTQLADVFHCKYILEGINNTNNPIMTYGFILRNKYIKSIKY